MTDQVGKAGVQRKSLNLGTSIRGRMLFLAIVAMAPLAFERIYSIESDRRAKIEDARQVALQVARDGAEKQNESIAAARATLKLLGSAYPKFIEGKAPCGEFLKAAVGGTTGVKTFSVVAPDGKIICSANPSSIGLDIADREFFQEALRADGVVVGDYVLGRRIPGPLVVVAYSVRSQSGAVDAVFTAVLDLDWISRVAANIAKRAGSTVTLVDGRGTVLTRYPNPEQWMGRRIADLPLIKTALAQSEGVVDAKGMDGVDRIFAFVQLPGTNARFIIGVDEKEVLRKVNGAMLWSYSQFVVIFALVLGGIWFGGNRFFVQPIRALAQTAVEIGEGRLNAHATQRNFASEFVPLATAMDKMADQLARHDSQLRAANAKLEILAQRDSLTNLANRHVFNVRLQAALQVSVGLCSPLALLIIDIDLFKRFNDRYGHLEGDACLRAIASVLSTGVRNDADLAARIGGEEFALMLPGATSDQAAKIAERIRQSVEDLAMSHADSPRGRVTVSIGVATVEDSDAETVDELIKAADEALYAAKSRGRNNVAVGTAVPFMSTA